MRKHKKDKTHEDLKYPNDKELSLISTKNILMLGDDFFKQGKHQKAITLYQKVIDMETAGSLQWLDASKKLGNTHFEICKKIISDKRFKTEQLSYVYTGNDDNAEETEKILLNMHFFHAQDNYHRYIQKHVNLLKDLYNLAKKSSSLQEPKSTKMLYHTANKIMNIVSKSLTLNELYYTTLKEQESNLDILSIRLSSTIDVLKNQLNDVYTTCDYRSSDALLKIKNDVDSQLSDCSQMASSMLGDANEVIPY